MTDWLLLFLIAHVGTTIGIGVWLNRMARREIKQAIDEVIRSLGPLASLLSPNNKERDSTHV